MRVAVWHNLPTGGAARALTNHINGLLKNGHEVEIWANNPLVDGFITIPASVILHTVPLKRTNETSFSDKWKSYFFDKDCNMLAMEEHCKTCADAILAGNFDVVYINACYFYAVPFIGKYLHGKIKTALNLGEPFRFFYEARPDMVWQAPPAIKTIWKSRSWMKAILTDFWINHKYRVQMREEKINSTFYDKILVNSYYSAETIMRVYNCDTIVNYIGINTEMFQSIANRTIKNYVIGLGNLYDNKNPELAIRAVGKIEKSIRPQLYWVANMTDPLMIDFWIALAKELDVEFIIKKMISDAELVVLLNEAICLLYTSKLEPFGMAPHEANLCGTPAVGVAQAGIRETIIDGLNGFLCQATPKDLASKVALLIKNPTLRNEMGEKGIQYVKENWNLEIGDKNLQKNLFEDWE